jgi:hypothetical protein
MCLFLRKIYNDIVFLMANCLNHDNILEELLSIIFGIRFRELMR